MRGVVLAAAFFALGFIVAWSLPAQADTRLAISDTVVDSISRIDFDAISVYPDQVIITEPGISYATVSSNSMAPLITDKSVVFEKTPEEDEIRAGDVISFYEPSAEGIVLHLVVDVVRRDGTTFYKTKGTANEDVDPWLVPFENVKGVLVGTFK